MDDYKDLLKLTPEEAKKEIQANGNDVYIIPYGCVATADLKFGRTRIWLNEDGTIGSIVDG
jgi:hypothetical protein